MNHGSITIGLELLTSSFTWYPSSFHSFENWVMGSPFSNINALQHFVIGKIESWKGFQHTPIKEKNIETPP